MKEEKKFVVDVDEPLAELMSDLNIFYNNTHDTNFSLEDYICYDLDKVWNCTKEEAVEIVNTFYKSPFLRGVKPVEFSQEAIKILSQRYDIIAVTARPDFIRKETEEWIEQHYNGDIQKIIFTNQYDIEYSQMSKLDICLKENAGIIVEDHPGIAIECAESGLIAFLLKKRWNWTKIKEGNGVIPVKNWNEILEKLK